MRIMYQCTKIPNFSGLFPIRLPYRPTTPKKVPLEFFIFHFPFSNLTFYYKIISRQLDDQGR